MAQSATVEWSARDETPSQVIVSAVSDLMDADPTTLDPLYHTVDPDALDALFEAGRGGGDRSPDRVEFTYCGCDVVVSGEGVVRVSKRQQNRRADSHVVRS